ncbi:MAG TPA: cytochrome C [Piscinibacter sp.]|nr:cytochrome C [Piscinibacter sp.]
MRAIRWVGRVAAFGLLAWSALVAAPAAGAAADAGALDNAGCLSCHDAKAHKLEVPAANGKARALLGIAPDKYAGSVHAKMQCVACHTGITDQPAAGTGHKPGPARTTASSTGCADCHQKLWDQAKADNSAAAKPRLGIVVDNIEAYRKSFHARGSKADRSKANASCDGCHDTHSFDIPTKASPAHEQWRLTSAAMCGQACHSDALEEYTASIHGKEALAKHNVKSAVCADCHSAHAVGNTSADPVKLTITANCGGCHAENYASYKATYHGQISTLGYAYTAKCYDCHGSHGILEAKNPESKVHPNNRMETCESCHNGKKGVGVASAGFATFQPHGRTDDFARYPQMWIGYQMMVGLLLGTFGFFWLHTLLWFWREFQDRRQGVPRPHVAASALPANLEAKHYRRFSAIWRLAHITFALSLMILTLTGMPLFYPDAAWAPWVMQALGGPKVAGVIHRVNAVIFAAVFFWHLGYMALNLWRQRKTFRWFGPDSMIPNLQDGRDMLAMFKWFFGRGPRPVFDRWTYWEKFDYWAPFWGVTIIGVSGLMMWLPGLTGTYLPGWVFNVAAIFHGEEAFLAVVFLFTVHFFNNHFRPDKFPVEIVMFTGTMSLEHYRREHPLEYQRMVESGELEKHLVDAPSAPMTFASKLLGFVLIAAGLTLLAGVAIGFFSGA